MPGIIIVFHTPSNEGYAMMPLEKMFFSVACELFDNIENIHFGFRDLDKGMPKSLSDGFKNVIPIDPSRPDDMSFKNAAKYIKNKKITIALCFDLQPQSPLCNMLRRSGVKHLISYWGSTMSSENHGIKLLLKRLEVALIWNKPDLFIFESDAMKSLAIFGRGINKTNTCVVPTGVDSERFSPDKNARCYIQNQFNINADKTIIYYSGHMEERKGVRVIIEAAIILIDKLNLTHFQFLICGNRPGEEQCYMDMLKDKKAINHVIFAGYRNDLDKITPGCDIGVIASTGWDSFPMSCLEMASCGLPLVVSSLQGLVETLEDGKTGFVFEPGNSEDLARHLEILDKDKDLMHRFSRDARNRILSGYSLKHQKKNLLKHISQLINN